MNSYRSKSCSRTGINISATDRIRSSTSNSACFPEHRVVCCCLSLPDAPHGIVPSPLSAYYYCGYRASIDSPPLSSSVGAHDTSRHRITTLVHTSPGAAVPFNRKKSWVAVSDIPFSTGQLRYGSYKALLPVTHAIDNTRCSVAAYGLWVPCACHVAVGGDEAMCVVSCRACRFSRACLQIRKSCGWPCAPIIFLLRPNQSKQDPVVLLPY